MKITNANISDENDAVLTIRADIDDGSNQVPIASCYDFNRRDKGEWEWTYEEALPGSYDYPKGMPS